MTLIAFVLDLLDEHDRHSERDPAGGRCQPPEDIRVVLLVEVDDRTDASNEDIVAGRSVTLRGAL